MKKKFIVFLMLLMILPLQVFASTETTNLKDTFSAEEIEADLSNYQETDDQITIYMFRGKGCGFCKKFLNFLASIIPDYGKYFKLEAYEVWYNDENADLMEEVADFLNEKATGVPFIVIGDKVFGGYSSSYDEDIKSAIKSLYESDKRYDVMKEIQKSKNKISPTVVIVLWNLFFFVVSTSIILIYMRKLNDRTLDALEEIEEKRKKNEKKGKKEA